MDAEKLVLGAAGVPLLVIGVICFLFPRLLLAYMDSHQLPLNRGLDDLFHTDINHRTYQRQRPLFRWAFGLGLLFLGVAFEAKALF